MYEILRFLHVLSAMAYFLFHGAVASVAFAIKREPGPKRIEVLSAVMVFAYAGAPIAGGGLVLTGIILGIMGHWWGDRWIWASVAVLLVIGILMNRLGKPYMTEGFARASTPNAQIQPQARRGMSGGMRAFLVHPMFFTVMGLIGLTTVLWLMMFKPL
jgi:MFS family permease